MFYIIFTSGSLPLLDHLQRKNYRAGNYYLFGTFPNPDLLLQELLRLRKYFLISVSQEEEKTITEGAKNFTILT